MFSMASATDPKFLSRSPSWSWKITKPMKAQRKMTEEIPTMSLPWSGIEDATFFRTSFAPRLRVASTNGRSTRLKRQIVRPQMVSTMSAAMIRAMTSRASTQQSRCFWPAMVQALVREPRLSRACRGRNWA